MKKFLIMWLLIWSVSLFWCWDLNSPVERGYSNLPPIPYCEENDWIVETIQEGWEEIRICSFEDKSYCILEDFANNICKKWDNHFIDNKWELDFLHYAD